ncbi:hypothetical protein LOAG_14360 [Loa loa]|uniref:Uncharacterized protein n=1 Tax=Loa loa TaxID=7209 RepID=A0A1S0THW2_LOALO|nr:hypothetical protein LOAG_14360 [Loa loa]EFO14164.1 hypothetical protein LOAG_14360 [Loa loa]
MFADDDDDDNEDEKQESFFFFPSHLWIISFATSAIVVVIVIVVVVVVDVDVVVVVVVVAVREFERVKRNFENLFELICQQNIQWIEKDNILSYNYFPEQIKRGSVLIRSNYTKFLIVSIVTFFFPELQLIIDKEGKNGLRRLRVSFDAFGVLAWNLSSFVDVAKRELFHGYSGKWTISGIRVWVTAIIYVDWSRNLTDIKNEGKKEGGKVEEGERSVFSVCDRNDPGDDSVDK